MGRSTYSPPTHFVIQSILTFKEEPPPKRLLDLQGNFLHTKGAPELGSSHLTDSHLSICTLQHITRIRAGIGDSNNCFVAFGSATSTKKIPCSQGMS